MTALEREVRALLTWIDGHDPEEDIGMCSGDFDGLRKALQETARVEGPK